MAITLRVNGIRCFSTPQEAVVRPLTLLVGENSSGKTTFLALCRIAGHILSGRPGSIDFNEAPFLLGSFDQIVSQSGRRRFSLEAIANAGSKDQISVRTVFVRTSAQPSVESWTLTAPSVKASITRKAAGSRVTVDVAGSAKIVSDVNASAFGGTFSPPLDS